MFITRKDVEHIAELARLKLKDEELEYFTHQLDDILAYIDQLNEIDTENVEPLSYPIEGGNVFREDICKPSLDREQALKNAPEQDGEFFKVPKVISGA